MLKQLYYIHDPMCSWCYAFKKTFDELISNLPNDIEVIYVCGGLAQHTTEIMPKAQQEKIKSIWEQIEKELGVKFNYDFWTKCQPKRATYLACQALILARKVNKEAEMIAAIQQAYYQKAMNPSEEETLIKLASQIDLDKEKFTKELNTQATQKLLEEDFNLRRNLNVKAFPTLILKYKKEAYPINIDFKNSGKMLEQITNLSENTYF